MNTRKLIGLIIMLIGLAVFVFPLIYSQEFFFISLIYGLIIIIFGIIIFFNKKEDEIEQIKIEKRRLK